VDATNLFLPNRSLRFAASATRAEQFSIWALRLWWEAFPDLPGAWSDFLHGFRVCGVQTAVESCHRFCSIVLATGACGTGVACLHAPHIAPTEEQLLAALAAADRGDVARVEGLLRTMVPNTAARIAAPLAVHYAQILTTAGLSWPRSPDVLCSERLH
jgi:hypothetical protein